MNPISGSHSCYVIADFYDLGQDASHPDFFLAASVENEGFRLVLRFPAIRPQTPPFILPSAVKSHRIAN